MTPNYAINPTPEQALRSNRAVLPARVIAALEFRMNRLALLLFISAPALAAEVEEPIPLGDPKRCMRVLAGLSCDKPGEVRFEGSVADGKFIFVRVLPPMKSPGTERVAACVMGNPAYFVPRFMNSKPNENGNYVYAVTAMSEICPD